MLNIEQTQNQQQQSLNAPSLIVEEIQDNLKENIIDMPENYLFTDKIQATTGQQFTSDTGTAIGATSQQSLFTIPTGAAVYDLSSFVLNFQVQAGLAPGGNTQLLAWPTFGATAGAGSTSAGVLCAWAYFFPYIQQIQLYTSNSTMLCDVNNVADYSRLTACLNLEKDNFDGSTMRGFACKSQRQTTYVVNAPTSGVSVTDPYIYQNTGTATVPQTIVNTYTAESNDDPAVLQYPLTYDNFHLAGYPTNRTGGPTYGPGTPAPNSTNIISVFNYSVKLSDILPDTVFGIKRSIYLSKASFIKITWSPVQNCFVSVSPDQTAIVGPPISGPFGFIGGTSLAGFIGTTNVAYEIRNLNMQFARLANPDLTKLIIDQQKIESVPVVVPFTTYDSKTFVVPAVNTNQQQSATYRISSSNAVSTLYKVYYGIKSPDGQQLYQNYNNINETIVQQIQHMINGTPHKNDNLTIREDIQYLNKMANSMCSYRAYRYSGVYPVLYDTNDEEKHYDGLTICGKELLPSNDIQLTFNSTVGNVLGQAGNYIHSLFNVQLRMFWFKNGEAYTNKV